MSKELKYTELIDAHLTGNLSPEESSRLMQLLEKDPALKEEFNLQQDLVNSLREHRKMQLKARLDNIEVGTGYSMPSAATLKLISGVALVGTLSVGAWFAYDRIQENETPGVSTTEETITENPLSGKDIHTPETNNQAANPQNPGTITENEDSSLAAEENNTQMVPDQRSENENSGNALIDKDGAEEVQPSSNRSVAGTGSATTKPTPTPERETAIAAERGKESTNSSIPEVVKPEVVSFFEEPDAVDSVPEANAPDDKLNEVHSFSTQNIEVTTRSDKQYAFHYMFHDNQLHIYGDFSQVPYEVLEVNSGNQTRYYLYHGGDYYELSPNQRKVTRLKELTNEKIIQELEITRTQKLNR